MKKLLGLLAFTASVILAQTVTGVVNNYSGINVGSVAQGAIFIVVGTGLADTQTTTLQSVPLQTTLGNVRIEVTVNGTTTFAPMYYALNTQLAGILPSNTPVGTGTLIVRNNNKSSPAVPIIIQRSGFGVLTTTGTTAARVQDASNGYQELTSTRATNPGNYLVFYGSGVGATAGNETVAQTGVNASGDLVNIATTVTIGGKTAPLLYRGRTAFPGLDQINVQVPTLDTTTYGCTVSVVITTGGVQANATTIPVAASGTTCPPPANNGGGGNISTIPTQSEIDSWANGYSYGSINIGRSTSYAADILTGTFSTTKSSNFDAFFGRISGLSSNISTQLQGFVNPTVGQCTVSTLTSSSFSPFPGLTFTSYDAGPAVTGVGPNGTQLATRSSTAGTFSYDAANLPANFITGGRYTLSGTGGANVGAFSGTLDVGSELTWTNWEDAKIVTRSGGLTVRWTGGDSSQLVSIDGSQAVISGSSVTIKLFSCLANRSAGQFNIPGSILSQLSASPTTNAGTFSFVTRGDISISNAGNGTRLRASGVDYFTANDSSDTTVTTEFR
ncbi:MAG: hypothetical protein ABIR70_23170 [Bryobacteraceae bacterium]